MTDPIREIIEEMYVERDGHLAIDSWISRLSAYWTPERAAFMEAAVQSVAFPAEMERRHWRHQMEVLYPALVESEKRDG